MLESQLQLSVLPQAQLALWPALAEFKDLFVLYGGTALALQLGHRESLDFDFFSSQTFDPGALRAKFRLLEQVEVLQSSPNTLTVFKPGMVGNVKISFFGGLNLHRVSPHLVSRTNGVRVASVLDLAGTKIKVLQDRAELKDYLDIAAVLAHGISLTDAVRAAMTIYGRDFNPMVSLKALTYFEDGDIGELDAGRRDLLVSAVREVDIRTLAPFHSNGAVFDAQDEGSSRATPGRGSVSGLKP